MILVLVLVLPRMGSGGLSCLPGFARFSDPMFESLSVSVCCGGRVCAGGWLLATVSSTCGPKERLLLSGGCCCRGAVVVAFACSSLQGGLLSE